MYLEIMKMGNVIFTFADVLWRKKVIPRSKAMIEKRSQVCSFWETSNYECTNLIKELEDPITGEFVVRLMKYYENGIAEKQSEYIV